MNIGPLVAQLRTFEAASLELELQDASQALDTLLRTLEQRCGFRQ